MSRRRHPTTEPAHNEADAALAALSADELREVVRGLLLELDDKAHRRAMTSLLQRAARGGSGRKGTGWAPAALSASQVAEVLAFAKAAERAGHADASDVDEYLERGASAFLRRDYAAAHRIFGALLGPIGDGDIDLGQHEMVDEVLGADVDECATQYVVCAYMLSPPADRATAVRAAIEEVQGVGSFQEPIGEMEQAAVEPLPELDAFLLMWRALIGHKSAEARKTAFDTEDDRWLREVVQRLEGSEGLAQVARATRRAEDLRAWCGSLVDAGDWKAALPAFEEAAGLLTEQGYARGELLDGAALAAQQLERGDLAKWLERAWRSAPSLVRLRRWLGGPGSKATLRKRAGQALQACPQAAARQRAFLHVLQGEFEQAATLLAAAPGLGWSRGEHPGHLLFPMFAAFLDVKRKPGSASAALRSYPTMDLEELGWMTGDGAEPKLANPAVEQLLRTAGIGGIPSAAARSAVLIALRTAAERRLAGVTKQKRRSHYGHAADLVAACVACDPSPETARWAASLTTEYRRFSALRAQLDRALGA